MILATSHTELTSNVSQGFPYKTAEALKDEHQEELKMKSKSKWD